MEERLDEFATLRLPPGDAESVRALLAHGRMLRDLLPTTDAVLKSLFAVATDSEQEAIRTLVVARQLAARASARQYRLLLYVTSLLLLGVLVHLGLRLRARAMALQRRAEFEHAIARISMRFINSQHYDITAHVESALGELAACIGADPPISLQPGTRCTSINGAATAQSFRRAGRSARSASHPIPIEARTEPSIFRT